MGPGVKIDTASLSLAAIGQHDLRNTIEQRPSHCGGAFARAPTVISWPFCGSAISVDDGTGRGAHWSKEARKYREGCRFRRVRQVRCCISRYSDVPTSDGWVRLPKTRRLEILPWQGRREGSRQRASGRAGQFGGTPLCASPNSGWSGTRSFRISSRISETEGGSGRKYLMKRPVRDCGCRGSRLNRPACIDG